MIVNTGSRQRSEGRVRRPDAAGVARIAPANHFAQRRIDSPTGAGCRSGICGEGVAMVQRIEPIVGEWYAHRDKGQLFQVVAVDADDGYIELQDFDGAVDEVDLETWRTMPLERAEAPEDFTGAVDDVEPDDIDAGVSASAARDRRGPYGDLPADLADEEDDEDADAE
jgi:hypothetical protein